MILKLEDGGRGGAGLEALVDEVAEIAAWCACAGIPTLSVYEQTGTLRYSSTVGQLLIQKRDSQGICSSDTQSDIEETFLLFRRPASSIVITSSSRTVYGISLK